MLLKIINFIKNYARLKNQGFDESRKDKSYELLALYISNFVTIQHGQRDIVQWGLPHCVLTFIKAMGQAPLDCQPNYYISSE